MILNLAGDSKLNLPLEPMVWALAFGACLGGISRFDTFSSAETHYLKFLMLQLFN